MNLREGKIGKQETICALAISLCVSGLFSIESDDAYTHGNSTYISIPLALLISAGVFLLAAAAIKKSGSQDLIRLFRYGAGKVMGSVLSVVFVFMLMVSAAVPITRFFDIIHNLYYVESNFFSLGIYVLPVLLIFGCLGFESIARAAKIFTFLVIFAHLALLLYASKTFDVLNLAPFVGDGLEHMGRYAFTGNIFFLPAMLAILCLTRGTQGLKNARTSGMWAAIASLIVCGATQLIIGIVYPYSDLAGIHTPLFNLNSISMDSNPMTRLDIITIFIWLLGAISAASFYTYSASYVYARTFDQRDIRPTVCAFATVTLCIIVASHLGEFSLATILVPLREYGFYFLTIPVAAVSLSSIIRAAIGKKRSEAGISET